MSRKLALALVVVGVIQVLIGFDQSPGVSEELKALLDGEFQRQTLWLMVGGAFMTYVALAEGLGGSGSK